MPAKVMHEFEMKRRAGMADPQFNPIIADAAAAPARSLATVLKSKAPRTCRVEL
jgi:hypothetical protein